ncbi:MAG: hypothetical protein J0L99_21900 [Chitinophagales bacterium]|nr:hypothetical protein [Chitinophagales bacterium]
MGDITIKIPQDQDLELLLLLLKRLNIKYTADVQEGTLEPLNREDNALSAKYAGKLSSATSEALLLQIEDSRSKWERNI